MQRATSSVSASHPSVPQRSSEPVPFTVTRLADEGKWDELVAALDGCEHDGKLALCSVSLGIDAGRALARSTTLTSLTIGYNYVNRHDSISIHLDALRALAGSKTLTELDLGLHSSYLPTRVECLKSLAVMETLTSLHLPDQGLGDEDALILARSTTLTSLDISNRFIRGYSKSNSVGVEGVRALAANTVLTTLHLGRNQVDIVGARALAKSTSLTDLDVDGHGLGDEGVKALCAPGATLPLRLTSLSICSNKMGDEGAMALAKACKKLTSIKFFINEVGDQGIAALASMKSLTYLGLEIDSREEKNSAGKKAYKAFKRNRKLCVDVRCVNAG